MTAIVSTPGPEREGVRDLSEGRGGPITLVSEHAARASAWPGPSSTVRPIERGAAQSIEATPLATETEEGVEAGDWDQEPAADSDARDVASPNGVVGGAAAEPENSGRLHDRDDRLG